MAFTGFNIAAFVQELNRLPQGYEVRLGFSEDADDVPLTKENLQVSDTLGELLIAPYGEDFANLLSDQPRQEPAPRVAPDMRPPARKHEGADFLEVTHVVFCRDCQRVFIAGGGVTAKDVLPCGHNPSVWQVASAIIINEENSRFLDWTDGEGLLDKAILELESQGGSFDYSSWRPRRLTLPKKED
jgi:hypothetical protein